VIIKVNKIIKIQAATEDTPVRAPIQS